MLLAMFCAGVALLAANKRILIDRGELQPDVASDSGARTP